MILGKKSHCPPTLTINWIDLYDWIYWIRTFYFVTHFVRQFFCVLPLIPFISDSYTVTSNKFLCYKNHWWQCSITKKIAMKYWYLECLSNRWIINIMEPLTQITSTPQNIFRKHSTFRIGFKESTSTLFHNFTSDVTPIVGFLFPDSVLLLLIFPFIIKYSLMTLPNLQFWHVSHFFPLEISLH